MSRHVVQRFITSPAFPERASGSGLRAIRKSKVAPYLAYLRERWEAGMHNGSHLFGEIKQRGYTGSASGLRRLLGEWRTALPPKARQGPPRKPRPASQPRQPRLSSRSAAFLMILPREKLDSATAATACADEPTRGTPPSVSPGSRVHRPAQRAQSGIAC